MQYSDKLDSTECCCSDWVLKDFALVSVDSLYWPLSVVVKVRRWLNSCLLVIHKKQNIIFPLSCPVLKVGCLLFLMLPSVNLQNVLAVWSVIRWMPYSSRYTWMVSLLHFIFEGKSCNTYFLGYHQLLKWSPRTRSFPWIHELHHSECPGRISVWRGVFTWRRSGLSSESQRGSQLRKGDRARLSMVSSFKAVSVIRWLRPAPAGVTAHSRCVGHLCILTAVYAS